ncbi:MAG: hypothetical protein KF703_16575, partial [Actinobacteria bacterium]|nr:hypothetical protein [Actinomycetota bacterium]
MSDQVPWPGPPREPGPWGGGPPVAPTGNTALPPLPGPGGVVHGTAGSNPWAAPSVPPPPPPKPPPSLSPFPGLNPQVPLVDRAPRWIVALSVLVVLALVAGTGYVLLRGGRQYPDSWDPRVEPIARWVARERQLDFEHPVEVRFLSPEEYTKASTGGDVELSDEEQQQMDDALAQMRALGLIEGKVDLNEAQKTLSDSGSLAYYDPDTEKVYVRGSKLTPGLRVTLAHELTHVLQDQHFDLQRVRSDDDGEGTVLRALAEGDATRIEDVYRDEVLTAAERKEYEKASQEESDAATEKLDAEVPPILTAFFASPYIFGPELITFLDQRDGSRSIDEALQDPPTEEVLWDPRLYGTSAAEPADVEVSAPRGAEEIDSGGFGQTAWYLLLASRIDPKAALTATDGLGGDAYVVYREDGKVCVRADASGDTPGDVE